MFTLPGLWSISPGVFGGIALCIILCGATRLNEIELLNILSDRQHLTISRIARIVELLKPFG